MNNITPEQSLTVLDQATAPANAGKLSRQDYINVQAALECFAAMAKRMAELEAAKPAAEPTP